MLTARGLRSAAALLAVVLATCSAATVNDVAGAPRVPVEWRAAWSVPADAGVGETPLSTPNHAVSAQAVAVATLAGAVRVHDPRTGAVRRIVAADPARPGPVSGVWIAGGVLVTSRATPDGDGQTLDGHDLTTGAALWRRTVTTPARGPGIEGAGSYLGPRILATERGIVVFERLDEPLDIQALDPRTGTDTARTTYPRGCLLTAAATARSVLLLSHCGPDELRLASTDPRTMRHEWTRALPSSSVPKNGHPAIRLTANAEGYAHVSSGADDFFCGPDGRPLSTGPGTVEVTGPDRWLPPLYAGSSPAANDHQAPRLNKSWPLPAYLISVDPGTGRLAGLPIDLPAHLVALAGSSRDTAFVYSEVPGDARLTAYELVYGPARPRPAWPAACTLLTGRDLAVLADGYRAVPGTDGAGAAAKCDWIPPADDGAIVSLSVDRVAPSDAGKLFAAEVAAVKGDGQIDPTTETAGFLTYTVHVTNGYYGATIINAGPVIVRLTSSSRRAVRLISPLLRDNLFARYLPGVRPPTAAREPGWSFPTDATVYADPVVAAGVVYATSGDGAVAALDAVTGAQRWRFRMGGSIMDAHVVAGGTVYVADTHNQVVALDAATGRPRWTRGIRADSDLVVAAGRLHVWARGPAWDAPAELVTLDAASGRRLWTFRPAGSMLNIDPVVAGDVVLTGSDHGVAYALDPATGAVRWRHRVGAAGDHVALVRAGTTVYATSAGGDVYALDARSGRVRWSSWVIGPVAARPVAAGATLYAGGADGTTFALSTATGTLRWIFPAAGDEPGVTWAAAVAGGLVYTVGRDRTLHALDTATGTERWRLPLAKGRETGPVAAGGAVHVTEHGGTLHVIDAVTGRVRSSFETGGTGTTGPVVAGGFVYVGSSNGNVYARSLPAR
ncbi:hypothetical protein FAF44_26000 [Nonomuraea sp. MG754425]|uniref:outer membrane protein assembly factor BamB family protein n=1 Tax=Nonomuraea sp. MG754425 TaxID=2570319 RepID=UPI001F3BF68B|nr:PQQ-binding-like beta-propeller repeat protein [Nonomuraea sp. MG754425]MCF6471819.1 hypothetical protein [Nonomuraea sp. MG754425]